MTNRCYSFQKQVARKYLMRAKELRGTYKYRGALKRAKYEMDKLRHAYRLLQA